MRSEWGLRARRLLSICSRAVKGNYSEPRRQLWICHLGQSQHDNDYNIAYGINHVGSVTGYSVVAPNFSDAFRSAALAIGPKLKGGKTAARETDPVKPVNDSLVKKRSTTAACAISVPKHMRFRCLYLRA